MERKNSVNSADFILSADFISSLAMCRLELMRVKERQKTMNAFRTVSLQDESIQENKRIRGNTRQPQKRADGLRSYLELCVCSESCTDGQTTASLERATLEVFVREKLRNSLFLCLR